jgi:hypothetical protein
VHEDDIMPSESISLAECCQRVLRVGAEGTDRAFAELTKAASQLTGAAGASVVSWQPTGPTVVAAVGATPSLSGKRIPEGISRSGRRTVASLVVPGRVDLVVWWEAGPLGSADQPTEAQLTDYADEGRP